ncbi:MAG: metal-sensitive transcriptional regulator [Candidatus Gracilibacteria bacterium]|nr:metal-sensitive transcriptional regulator [Candidatus Gracilibacteria bacterium]
MQQDFQNRLRRLEGQIRALQTLTQASDCKKTIIQFQAAQAALDKCFANYLQRNLQECLKQKQTQKLDEILHSLTQQGNAFGSSHSSCRGSSRLVPIPHLPQTKLRRRKPFDFRLNPSRLGQKSRAHCRQKTPLLFVPKFPDALPMFLWIEAIL